MANPFRVVDILRVDLVRLEIIQHLDLLERQAIRLVSREFRDLVDAPGAIIVRELVVKPFLQENRDAVEEPNYVRSHRWYSTKEFANQRNFVPCLRLPKEPFPAQLTFILPNLQRLRLGLTLTTRQLVQLSANLTSLQHLEISRLAVQIEKDNQLPNRQCVSLSHLRVLCISSVYPGDEEVRVIFKSPKLSTVCLGKFEFYTLNSNELEL